MMMETELEKNINEYCSSWGKEWFNREREHNLRRFFHSFIKKRMWDRLRSELAMEYNICKSINIQEALRILNDRRSDEEL